MTTQQRPQCLQGVLPSWGLPALGVVVAGVLVELVLASLEVVPPGKTVVAVPVAVVAGTPVMFVHMPKSDILFQCAA